MQWKTPSIRRGDFRSQTLRETAAEDHIGYDRVRLPFVRQIQGNRIATRQFTCDRTAYRVTLSGSVTPSALSRLCHKSSRIVPATLEYTPGGVSRWDRILRTLSFYPLAFEASHIPRHLMASFDQPVQCTCCHDLPYVLIHSETTGVLSKYVGWPCLSADLQRSAVSRFRCWSSVRATRFIALRISSFTRPPVKAQRRGCCGEIVLARQRI